MDASTLTIRRLSTSARTPTHNWFNSSTRKLSHSIHLGDARSSQTQATHGWVCRNDLPNDVHIKFDPPPGAVAAAKQQCRRARLAQHKLVLPGKEELAIKIYALSHLKTHHSPNTGHCVYIDQFNMYNILYTRCTNRHARLWTSEQRQRQFGAPPLQIMCCPCVLSVRVCVCISGSSPLFAAGTPGRKRLQNCSFRLHRLIYLSARICSSGVCVCVGRSVGLWVCTFVRPSARACLRVAERWCGCKRAWIWRANRMRIVYVLWALLVWLSAFEVSAYVNVCMFVGLYVVCVCVGLY